MASTPRPDFARVARLRGAEQGVIDEAARQGLIPEDIAHALAAPGVSDFLLFQRFEVVADLDALAGPRSGVVDVPRHLVDGDVPALVDVADAALGAALYRRLLIGGTATEQAALINRDVLLRLWPRRLAPHTVAQVWERRFPELTAA
ncbi:hypothetical protein [Streptomyces fulvoviolaceus]|uniref:hypothetical protein n=1 Tax=Streptomyces fulvoviolaceus TaxID=285535 RepID=UPI0021BF2AA3|nr:hypothetical protein [Streptomyces fulvoviolaceus]MCT9075281.1 hypothetical protein [Streptomyces fulvoviolaceus]